MRYFSILLLFLLSFFAQAATVDFFEAARQGDSAAIESYLSQDINLEATNEDGYTAFILAAYYNHIEVLDLLLKGGANPCAVDTRGNNALMAVSFRGHVNAAEWLLDNTQCGVNYQNFAGQTALMMASLFGHQRIVKLLLVYGANPDLQDFQGNTAISLAQAQGLTDIVETIQSHSHMDKKSASENDTPQD